MAGMSIESLLLGEPDDLTTPEKASALAGALKRKQNYGLLGQLMNLEPTKAFGGALQEQAQQGLKLGLGQQASARDAKAAQAAAAAEQARFDRQQKLREQEAAANAAYRNRQLGIQSQGLDIRRQQLEAANAAKQAALDARGVAQGIKARAEAGGAVSKQHTATQTLQQIEDMLQHPGRKAATGKSELLGYMPWTDARAYRAELDKLRGGAFLQAFNSLRGGGQITEAEGKKATAAMTILAQDGLPEATHEKALRDFYEVVDLGRRRAEGEAAALGVNPEQLLKLRQPGEGDPENLGEF